ncbi:nucleotide-diphosphate-sugar epimerase [Actinomycetospora sp. NBRC 106375]|uniref:NAD(P)H-binding protein n=1 Tax=Actinomycetospora sp. NBRC 106375 TaxID=3032207 RepID=UPI0024A38393|nr:NAD(P)H-binding protein [Actinomycetospora sp. NBRC 106375]GLZ48570.1 nucleotide-diphosphate-sugar epimerase [Actinomycetospora sp. NBRC 106375]
MILVTGARGRVGRAVIDALLATGVPAGDIRGAGRDASRLDLPPGVEPVAVDLTDPATLVPALDGVEQVLLYAQGDTSGLADAADAAGVEHVVLLSSMSSTHHDPADRIGEMHREAEKPLVDADLTATLLRPGAFAANTLDWAAGVRAGVVELPYPDSHVTPIHEADIADVAVAALAGGAVRGTAPTLSGPASLSFRDQVATIAAEVGRDVEVVGLAEDEYRERMSRYAPAWVADSLLHLWAPADGVPQPVHDVTPILGRPGRTFAQWAHDHRDAFA